MTTILLSLLLGCGLTPDDEARLQSLEAKIQQLEAELAESRVPPREEPDPETLEEKRARRLEALRSLRKRHEAPGDAPWYGEEPEAVAPSTMREALEDVESFLKYGRVLRYKGPGGNYDGYRLSAIRHGTPWDRIGLKNGDAILEIGGHPLTSIEAAMEAYVALKDVDRVNVVVVRRHTQMILDIGLDDPLPVAGDVDEADPATED